MLERTDGSARVVGTQHADIDTRVRKVAGNLDLGEGNQFQAWILKLGRDELAQVAVGPVRGYAPAAIVPWPSALTPPPTNLGSATVRLTWIRSNTSIWSPGLTSL